MRTLRHPNIVEFLGVCMEAPNLCLVTEYLSNGSLEDVLERMSLKDGKFSLKRIISLAKDIARGLNWLHHKGIIHRDLKSANILLDQNGKGKICFPQRDHQLLTSAGFMSLQQIKHSLQQGRQLSVACPVRRQPDDELATLAMEYHPLSLSQLIEDASSSLVSFRSLQTADDDVDLLLTPNHTLPVSFNCSAQTTKLSAEQILCSSAASILLVCHTEHGVSGPSAAAAPPLAAPLPLRCDDEVDAFVELFGFCNAVDRLDSGEDAAVFTFAVSHSSDVAYVDALLARLPLKETATYTRQLSADDGERADTKALSQHHSVRYCVHDPVWCDWLVRREPAAETAAEEQRPRLACRVWRRLDARRLRLLLRGARVASGNVSAERRLRAELQSKAARARRSNDVSAAERLELRLRDSEQDGWPLVPAVIHTASQRLRDEFQHLALRAGFTAVSLPSAACKSEQWSVGYHSRHSAAVRLRLVVNGRLGCEPEVALLRCPSPVAVWCVNVPTADHLIVVRRVRSWSVDGEAVDASRPIVVGNCDFGLSHVKVRQRRHSTHTRSRGGTAELRCACCRCLLSVAWTCPARTASAARPLTWRLRC